VLQGDQKAVVPASALGAAAATPGWAHKVVEASFPLLLTTGTLPGLLHCVRGKTWLTGLGGGGAHLQAA
jgi:hypothetical protein